MFIIGTESAGVASDARTPGLVSFARLDGGLPNDLAGSANDMAIWLAAGSLRAPSASYRW
jgi:hypothetical protein